MWVMGVPHPGWRPSTPVEASLGYPQDLAEDRSERRGSGSSERPSPPSKTDSASLRPTTWKKSPPQPISPPAKGFGNIFSTSTLSLALPASITNGSPVKEGDRVAVMESPSKGKKTKADKEILTWPTQCELASVFVEWIS
jgi:cysteine protease ATG4